MLPEAGNKNVITDVIGNPGNILTDETGAKKIIDFVPATEKRMRDSILATGPRATQLRKRNKIVLSPKQRLSTLAEMHDPAKMQEYLDAVMGDQALMRKMQNPRILREGLAAQLSDQWGVAVQPSDVGSFGLRRADALRTLRGL